MKKKDKYVYGDVGQVHKKSLIDEKNKMARKLDMSYGQYVAFLNQNKENQQS